MDVIDLTAFNKAWNFLKADEPNMVDRMEWYEPTPEQLTRNRQLGYKILPENEEEHKKDLDRFKEDSGDREPNQRVFDNLKMKYGTPNQGPLENPEDDASVRAMDAVLQQMAARKK